MSINVVLAPLRALSALNGLVLRIGWHIAWVAMFLMVVVMLIQVFFRYVLNNALPWPDEAARFLMLWMTGFMGPAAYRQGGFVAIDMVSRFLPRVPVLLFALFLLGLSLLVLVVAVQLGFQHVKSGWLFASSTLKIPLQLFGGKAVAIKLAWMYMSLYVGVILLVSVNIELILKAVARLADEHAEIPEDAAEAVVGAE